MMFWRLLFGLPIHYCLCKILDIGFEHALDVFVNSLSDIERREMLINEDFTKEVMIVCRWIYRIILAILIFVLLYKLEGRI